MIGTMGEETMEPDSTDGSRTDPIVTAFTALDRTLWEPLGAAALLRSQPQFDETVLDAWCGDGAAALPTAALVGPAGRVDAIDPHERLTAIARERAEGMPQLHLHVADPSDWQTGDYDLVQCVVGLTTCATPDSTARHLASLVRPGGRMVISLWAHDALEPLRELARDAFAAEQARSADRDEPVEVDETEPEAEAETESNSESEPEGEPGTESETEGEPETEAERAGEAESREEPEDAEGSEAPDDADRDEASAETALPGTAGTLATMLHELGLVDVRAERVDRHLDLEGDLAWQLVVGARLLPSEASLDDETLERLRRRVLDGVTERGLDRVDASTLIAVGRRAA